MKKNYEEQMVVQEWMTKALVELMKEHSYDSITVKQICEKAGVSRMTYYRNYVSKDDIFSSYSSYLTQLLAEEMRKHSVFTAKSYWSLLFSFIYENREFISTLVNSGKGETILDIMNANLESIIGSEHKFAALISAGGFYNMMLNWAKSNFSESPERLAETMCRMMNPVFTEMVINAYSSHFDKL